MLLYHKESLVLLFYRRDYIFMQKKHSEIMKHVPKSVSSSVSLHINNVQTKGVHTAYINGKTSIKGKGEIALGQLRA